MKNSLAILLLISLFYSQSSFSQESFKKRYNIKKVNLNLVKESYYKLSQPIEPNDLLKEKKEIAIAAMRKKIEEVSNNYRNSFKAYDLEKKEVTITEKEAKKPDIEHCLMYKIEEEPDFYNNKCTDGKTNKLKGNLLFDEEKLYVNMWNFKYKNNDNPEKQCKDDKKVLFHTFKDGETKTLWSWQMTSTALTIPFKYRPKDGDNDAIPSTFSTSFNAGLFAGYSMGWTKFHHRKKVGNKTIENKVTLGAFLGAASEELSSKNTNGDNKFTDSQTESIGLLSRGFGLLYSRNKINVGVFMGWDKGIGTSGKAWNHDGHLWLGAGLGYDIFKL